MNISKEDLIDLSLAPLFGSVQNYTKNEKLTILSSLTFPALGISTFHDADALILYRTCSLKDEENTDATGKFGSSRDNKHRFFNLRYPLNYN